jgi:hypothetical protein
MNKLKDKISTFIYKKYSKACDIIFIYSKTTITPKTNRIIIWGDVSQYIGLNSLNNII